MNPAVIALAALLYTSVAAHAQLPTKYQLVINIKTANALGLNVLSSMQLLADEVIE